MSVKVMSWVWENGPTDPVERLVLLALADFADDQGNCYPSMIGIGAKACVTERGARGIVRRLEAAGWVKTSIGGGRGGKSKYQIVMEKPGTVFPECDDKPGTTFPEYETRKDQNPERDDTKPGTLVPPNRQEPSIKEITPFIPQPEKPQRRSRKVGLPPDWVPSDRNIADAHARQFSASEIENEAAAFRDYHLAHASIFADWDAAWRTWLGNRIKWGRTKPRSDASGAFLRSVSRAAAAF